MKWIALLLLTFSQLNAAELLLATQDGQTYMIDVDPSERLCDLDARLAMLTEDERYVVAVPAKQKPADVNAGTQGGYLGYARDYSASVTQAESNDIRFIVTSLADKSLMAIAFIKGDLEEAGDRIDHLHPLRFLMTMFTDEEMKVAIRNIRGRGWIWSNFAGGLKQSLATETRNGNMKDEYIIHFAQTVEVDVNHIYPAIAAHNWDHLLEVLINEVPRKGNHDRYDN